MAGDAAVSAGVVIVALAIGQTGWLWLDPAASFAIGARHSVEQLGPSARWTLNLALDAVPAGVDPAAGWKLTLRASLAVAEIHDLHIWGMSTTETALTAHLVRPGSGPDDHFLADVSHELERRFRIQHATIQIETGEGECRLAPANVV